MNAKFVVAVLVALQVSQALSGIIPTPNPEVVQKYNEMKETFKKRVENLLPKIQAYADNYEQTQQARSTIEGNQKVAVMKEFAAAAGDELAPAIDKLRSAVLGIYSGYLRPFVGEYVQQAYANLKPVLDKHLPAEES